MFPAAHVNLTRHWLRATAAIAVTALIAAMLGLAAATPAQAAGATTLTEGFADITTLTAQGWNRQNLSTPVGSASWFQGNTGIFSSQAGAANSYVGANFNNTTGDNTISNWLLTPELSLNNGATFSFWTRTITTSNNPDRLQVRLSTNGSSTDVGIEGVLAGHFNTVLADINPTLTVGGYPNSWTQHTLTLSAIPAATSGRIGFHYFVTNGGGGGVNSNYIGIDTVSYAAAVPAAPAPPPPPATPAPVSQQVAGTVRASIKTKKNKKVALPASTTSGTPLRWSTRTPKACKVASGRLVLTGKKRTCKIVATAAGDATQLALTRRYAIRLK